MSSLRPPSVPTNDILYWSPKAPPVAEGSAQRRQHGRRGVAVLDARGIDERRDQAAEAVNSRAT